MVPEGKSCFCCEMYCFGPDPLLEMDDQAIVNLALADCAGQGYWTRRIASIIWCYGFLGPMHRKTGTTG